MLSINVDTEIRSQVPAAVEQPIRPVPPSARLAIPILQIRQAGLPRMLLRPVRSYLAQEIVLSNLASEP